MEFSLKIFLLSMALSGHARIISAPRKARLTAAEPSPSYYFTDIHGYPGTYAFGYDVRDPHTGNVQFRNEERYPNGTVVGDYGYTDGGGRHHSYRYVADERGYRVMNAKRKNPAVIQPAQLASGSESSVTWSRPKKNKKPANYFTKLPINKGNSLSSNNMLLPPSYYAVD